MVQLLEELLDRISGEELELFLVQCWVIWNQRNAILHGGKLQDPQRLNRRAEDFLKEFREAQNHLSVQASGGVVQPRASWSPPLGLLYKLNFDAAMFEGISASGFGAIVHNDKGEVMAAISARGPPVVDSEEAEVLACKRAIEFAVEAGFRELIIEGDNATVMKTIMSSDINLSRLGHIYKDIGCMVLTLQTCSFSCVKRTANSAAHALAKYARQVEDEVVWLEESPPPILEALYLDNGYFMNE